LKALNEQKASMVAETIQKALRGIGLDVIAEPFDGGAFVGVQFTDGDRRCASRIQLPCVENDGVKSVLSGWSPAE
jgi:hypothetical protein